MSLIGPIGTKARNFNIQKMEIRNIVLRSVVFVSVLTIILVVPTEQANILVVFPIASYSHFKLGNTLVQALSGRGHHVTFVTPYPQKSQHRLVTDISISETVDLTDDITQKLLDMDQEDSGVFTVLHQLANMTALLTESTLKCKEVQELLGSEKAFDLVLVEYSSNEALLGFAYKFAAPLVVFTTNRPSIITNALVGNPLAASYIPNIFTSFQSPMNFFERLQNAAMDVLYSIFREQVEMPKQRQLFNKYVANTTSDKVKPNLDSVLLNTSILLTNSHLSFTNSQPLAPNSIEVGGFHIESPKPLDRLLKSFMDKAKDGVVVFSLGATLQSRDLDPEIMDEIIAAFGKMKQKILWKYEEMPNRPLPKNIKIMYWLPLNDVLAHPNVKAFITHGGALSIIEAIYHGIPVVGLPVFSDQKNNIASAVHDGYAISIPLAEVTEAKLCDAVTEITTNLKYEENAQLRSRVLRDRPVQPLDNAIYWLEYVIRHQGAPLLRTGATRLTWYKREMLDVAAFVMVIATLILIVGCKVVKMIFNFLSKSIKSKRNSSRKNDTNELKEKAD